MHDVRGVFMKWKNSSKILNNTLCSLGIHLFRLEFVDGLDPSLGLKKPIDSYGYFCYHCKHFEPTII